MNITNFIKYGLRILTWPLPPGLGWGGSGSRMARPRQIRGAKYISIGSGTRILPGGELTCLDNYYGQVLKPSLVIGDSVYIGKNVCVVCADRIRIEDECVLSDHVYLADNAHGLDPESGPLMRQPLQLKGPVLIGRKTFIGYRAVIMPGVSLGPHCVVGANAVVTRSFPAGSMIAGVPAKLVKTYDEGEKQWLPVAK